MLTVQKFGGSSLADAEKLRRAADTVLSVRHRGQDVAVVVSAMGDTTDELIALAHELNPDADARELDALMSTGENQSAALLAIALERAGARAISLAGWQAGVYTDDSHGGAALELTFPSRAAAAIKDGIIPVVAGFQGVDIHGDVTTLGRGGSDTSAVALAAALGADRCEIYTDVDGVYSADPRKVPTAKKLKEISYDEMLELASLGAQVLHNRSVEMAKKYHVELEVLSSFEKISGTVVREDVKVEKMLVTGVAKDTNVARISVIGLEDVPGVAFRLFSLMGQKNIVVDIILQSIGRNGTKDISFTVSENQLPLAVSVLEDVYGKGSVSVESDVAKVSVVGAGMETNAGVAAKMFEALYSVGANIHMISTSEIKISVLIDRNDADKAVAAIHEAFIG